MFAPPESSADGVRPLGVGIIGFGRLARSYYLPALRALSMPLELHVADPAATSRAAARRLLPHAPVCEEAGALLASRAPLDAFLVASPPSTHLEIWGQAAERQLPVFMEKPFLLPGELPRIDPRDPRWGRLMIDLNRRFWPPYRDLARRVAADELGRAVRAAFTLRIDPVRWAGATDHRADARQGGALLDLGSHVLDLVWWIFRQTPSEIRGRRTAYERDERIELELAFASGLSVDCYLEYGRRNRESVTIHGERGHLRLDDPNGRLWSNPPTYSRWARKSVDTLLLAYRALVRHRSMLRYSVSASLERFLTSIRDGTALDPGFDDAHRVARWCAAAATAIETGRGVGVEEPPHDSTPPPQPTHS